MDKSIERIKRIYRNMKQRCYNPNNQLFADYGARGISICETWFNDVDSFVGWALSHGYQDNLTIDRKDVNGDYEPSNCRWATVYEQANNKRNTYGLGEEGQQQRKRNNNVNGKTRTMTMRLTHDVADYIENRVKEENSSRGTVVENIVMAYQNINVVCDWCDIDTNEFCKQVEDLFMKGHLVVDKDGVLKVKE